jgi:hypothetical protein
MLVHSTQPQTTGLCVAISSSGKTMPQASPRTIPDGNLAVPALHLDPRFADHPLLISTNASRAIELRPDWIDQTPADALWFSQTVDMADLLARQLARKPSHAFALSTQ